MPVWKSLLGWWFGFLSWSCVRSGSIPLSCEEWAHPSCTYVSDLLNERVGYGRWTIGGTDGPIVRVTSLANVGPGTLREAMETETPAWIVFDVNGTIEPDPYLRCGPYKTIDGRGSRIRIQGYGIRLSRSHQAIVTDIAFRANINDAVSISRHQHAWIHHCDMGHTLHMDKDVADGVVDITHGSADVTVSWSCFSNHAKGFLINGNVVQEVAATNVTYHHNLFRTIRTRTPMVQGGSLSRPVRFHSFNNVRKDVSGLRGHAIDVRPRHTLVRVEADAFLDSGSIGCSNACEMTTNTTGYAWVVRDVFRRGGRTFPDDAFPERVFVPPYPYVLDSAENVVERVETSCGPRTSMTRSFQ